MFIYYTCFQCRSGSRFFEYKTFWLQISSILYYKTMLFFDFPSSFSIGAYILWKHLYKKSILVNLLLLYIPNWGKFFLYTTIFGLFIEITFIKPNLELFLKCNDLHLCFQIKIPNYTTNIWIIIFVVKYCPKKILPKSCQNNERSPSWKTHRT